MIINVSVPEKKINKILEISKKNNIDSINQFIKIAIDNQIELEKDKTNINKLKGREEYINKIQDNKKEKNEYLIKNIKDLDGELLKHLDQDTIKKRNNEPFWSLKNKYFPVKLSVRMLSNLIKIKNKNGLDPKYVKDEIKDSSISIRTDLEKIDKKDSNKRGEKYSTALPKDNSKSFDRFFKSFIINNYKSDKNINGLAYELGFIDVKDNLIYLTKKGANFSKIYSPILDGYFINETWPNNIFSEEEREFLYNYIKKYKKEESSIYKFILREIDLGNNTTQTLNVELKDYLSKRHKNKNYTDKTISSLRGSIISRMSEIDLISIKRKGLKNYYHIEKYNRKKFVGD